MPVCKHWTLDQCPPFSGNRSSSKHCMVIKVIAPIWISLRQIVLYSSLTSIYFFTPIVSYHFRGLRGSSFLSREFLLNQMVSYKIALRKYSKNFIKSCGCCQNRNRLPLTVCLEPEECVKENLRSRHISFSSRLSSHMNMLFVNQLCFLFNCNTLLYMCNNCVTPHSLRNNNGVIIMVKQSVYVLINRFALCQWQLFVLFLCLHDLSKGGYPKYLNSPCNQ